MENSKENNIDIQKEQNNIREKIDSINKANIFTYLHEGLTQFANKNIRGSSAINLDLKGRVKKADSACEKIARQNVPASEIYDLIGFMLVVDLPEEYEETKGVMKSEMPSDAYIHDFDGDSPKNNGYSSYHMGVKAGQLTDFALSGLPEELKGVSTEVQLKTFGMYMAQEATHDTIYKDPSMDDDKKDQAQTVLFPLIEKIVNVQKYQEKLEISLQLGDTSQINYYQQRISAEQQKILAIKNNNREFISANPILTQNVLKEFILAEYMEKAKFEAVLSEQPRDLSEMKKDCKAAIENLLNSPDENSMSNTHPTGFKKIDTIFNQIMNSSPEQIHDLSIRENKQQPNLLSGVIEQSQEEVTSSDITQMVNGIKAIQKTQSRTDPNIEKDDSTVR